MNHWRPRESRKSVHIGVRVRTDEGWIDATVRNVSQRGLMLHSPRPLRRNQFVEVARGRQLVVGRIVWSDATAAGMQARDCVDIGGLLAQSGAGSSNGADDRRSKGRASAPVPGASIAERAEASRLLGRGFEKAFMVLALASVSILAVGSALEAANAPIAKVGLALAGSPG